MAFQNSRLSYLVPESTETKLALWRRHDSHMIKGLPFRIS